MDAAVCVSVCYVNFTKYLLLFLMFGRLDVPARHNPREQWSSMYVMHLICLSVAVCMCEGQAEPGADRPVMIVVSNVCVPFVLMQEVTATSRHYVDRLFDPDPQKVLQGVM